MLDRVCHQLGDNEFGLVAQSTKAPALQRRPGEAPAGPDRCESRAQRARRHGLNRGGVSRRGLNGGGLNRGGLNRDGLSRSPGARRSRGRPPSPAA